MPDMWLYHENERKGRLFRGVGDKGLEDLEKDGWVTTPADLSEPPEPDPVEDNRPRIDVEAAITRFKAPRHKLSVKDSILLGWALGIDKADELDAAALNDALKKAIRARDRGEDG